MKPADNFRSYIAILKRWAYALVLCNLVVLAYLVYLSQSEHQLRRTIGVNQDFMCATGILQLNWQRIYFTANDWIHELSPASPQAVEMLAKWQAREIDIVDCTLNPTSSNIAYVSALRTTANSCLAKFRTFAEQLPSQLKTAEGKKAASAEFDKLNALTDVATNALFAKQYNDNLNYLVESAVNKSAEHSRLFQEALLAALLFDSVSILALALMPIFSKKVMQSFRDNTSLFQKFCILAAIPLLGQLSIYALLGGMAQHTSSELRRLANFEQTEELCRQLMLKTGDLLLAGSVGDASDESKLLEQISKLKRENRPPRLFLDKSYDELLQIIPEALRLRPAGTAEELWTGAGRSLYGDEIFRQLCERIFTLERYSFPSIGQDELVKRQREILEEQVSRIILMMNVSLLACLFQLALCAITLRLFAKTISQRFGSVQSNIERYSRNESFNPPLEGLDEASSLESFLRQTARIIEDLSIKERQMIDNAGEVIFSISDQMMITSINDAAQKTWGYSSSELLGKSFKSLIFEQDLLANMTWVRDLRELAQGRTLELRIKHKDESLLNCLISAQWSADTAQIFCVAKDISVQKQIERLKQDFLAMVSHDVRTPLTASVMFLELLEMGVYGEISADGAESLQRIMELSRQLMALIKDLLDIERLQTGAIDLDKEEIELSELRPEFMSIVADALKAKSITAEVRCADEIYIRGDEAFLLRAITNVLFVAIDQSLPGSTLVISMTQTSATAEILVEWMNDLNKSALSHDAFEIYLARSSQYVVPGTSSKLGLPLVRSIFLQHQGDVVLSSTAGKTSCRLTLPAIMQDSFVAVKVDSLASSNAGMGDAAV